MDRHVLHNLSELPQPMSNCRQHPQHTRRKPTSHNAARQVRPIAALEIGDWSLLGAPVWCSPQRFRRWK